MPTLSNNEYPSVEYVVMEACIVKIGNISATYK